MVDEGAGLVPVTSKSEPIPHAFILKGANGLYVGHFDFFKLTEEARQEQLRDALLIAAAPDLYAALTKINEWACFASQEDVSARLMALQQIGLHARAAIAKAEGRA